MSIVFSNISIDTINFISDINGIKFELIDSFKDSCQYCGEIVCENVFIFKMDTNFDNKKFNFPCFVCDITITKIENDKIESKINELRYSYKFADEPSIPESEEYYVLKIQGGELDITALCSEVKVMRV